MKTLIGREAAYSSRSRHNLRERNDRLAGNFQSYVPAPRSLYRHCCGRTVRYRGVRVCQSNLKVNSGSSRALVRNTCSEINLVRKIPSLRVNIRINLQKKRIRPRSSSTRRTRRGCIVFVFARPVRVHANYLLYVCCTVPGAGASGVELELREALLFVPVRAVCEIISSSEKA